MKNISNDIFNELERICELLAPIEDPCLYCNYSPNSFYCEDCMQGKECVNDILQVEESIPEEIKEIYRELKDIGWVEKKVEEKQAVLHIVTLKKIKEISERKAEEILDKNGYIVEEE